MQLSHIPRIIIASLSLLIVQATVGTPSAVAQSAQSQTITSGIVKTTAPVGSGRLWIVYFTDQPFVAYASTPPAVGTEVSIEIVPVADITGGKHDVAYVMTPRK